MRDLPKRTANRTPRLFTSTPQGAPARFLGYVQVHVGPQIYALPVQAVDFSQDDDATAGGFFAEPSGQLGILVDDNASLSDQRDQIDTAIADAARHLSRRFLN
jgi:hypothetical protein